MDNIIVFGKQYGIIDLDIKELIEKKKKQIKAAEAALKKARETAMKQIKATATVLSIPDDLIGYILDGIVPVSVLTSFFPFGATAALKVIGNSKSNYDTITKKKEDEITKLKKELDSLNENVLNFESIEDVVFYATSEAVSYAAEVPTSNSNNNKVDTRALYDYKIRKLSRITLKAKHEIISMGNVIGMFADTVGTTEMISTIKSQLIKYKEERHRLAILTETNYYSVFDLIEFSIPNNLNNVGLLETTMEFIQNVNFRDSNSDVVYLGEIQGEQLPEEPSLLDKVKSFF